MELKLDKLKVVQMGTPFQLGASIRIMDDHDTPAVIITARESQWMGQNQWITPLRIEVGDVVIHYDFPGRFEKGNP